MIADLSHPFTVSMSVWPGTPVPEVKLLRNRPRHGYEERRLTLTSHAGTHVDAPAHLLDGPALDALPLERFTGPGCVADVRACAGRPVRWEDLERSPGWAGPREFVLLWTGWDAFWGMKAYLRGYPVLDPAVAGRLAAAGIKGLGVDAASVDAFDSRDLPVHRALLSRGVVLVENLRGIGALAGRAFRFAAFPLPIPGGDGSPVRAVAFAE